MLKLRKFNQLGILTTCCNKHSLFYSTIFSDNETLGNIKVFQFVNDYRN